ncbi:MAG: 16S rRNA (cytosine1402-N4)-methyltransferase [bacterium P3]|nr:MAG: 16S rRNA (cytosine1402-N4)-methyltransferase [bacterium P3]KWW40503.1 MAG: 16S rRNA (cytosine1402-N4)-methyltransferase [bacterium F083]
MEAYHLPVLLNECIEGLNIRPDGTYVDVTFGGGGHSRAILERLGPAGRLIAFDRDADAQRNALDDARFTLIHEDFRYLKNFLRLHGVRHVDGLLADLGVSSHQLDSAERGFSTRFDSELDLRMDCRAARSARDVVNGDDEQTLRRILSLYGELPNASAMARSICAARGRAPIDTTFQLKDAVAHLLPRGRENKTLAMLFQALRIEVNGELESLSALLEQSSGVLKAGGRLAVISYHSLEDRIVKNHLRSGRIDGIVQQDFYGNKLTPWRIVSRKAVTPSVAEVADNSRARSAKLRIAERRDDG